MVVEQGDLYDVEIIGNRMLDCVTPVAGMATMLLALCVGSAVEMASLTLAPHAPTFTSMTRTAMAVGLVERHRNVRMEMKIKAGCATIGAATGGRVRSHVAVTGAHSVLPIVARFVPNPEKRALTLQPSLSQLGP